MIVREMLKLFHDDGWVVVRQRGSLRQLQHPTKSGTVTAAGHPKEELDLKTRRSILKQAGLQ
jgi:predicted RNA binding protein YcfA (HicA-like mRNA interferase family)